MRSIGMFEGLLNQRHTLLLALAQRSFDLLLPLAQREHLIGNIQRRKHGDLQRRRGSG